MAIDTAPQQVSTVRDDRRKRLTPRRVVAVVIVVATLVVASGTLRGGHPMDGHASSSLLDPAIRGIYESETGAQITLLGTETRPYFEMEGRQEGLAPDGPGRYISRTDPGTRITLRLDTSGDVAGLTLERGGQPAVRAVRAAAYTEESVTFASEDAVLSGTLLVPNGQGPYPAVVVVHGAEWSTREIYRLQATHHARRGLAVLIYDKRGLGESMGDVASATFDDLANDALAGVEVLRSDPRIDPARVGVYGMSQGGWIAAISAQRSDDVAFVATVSPSGFSPADQNAWLYGSMLAVRGMGTRPIAAGDRFVRMLYGTTGLIDAGLMRPIPHVPGFWFHALDPHLDTATLWEGVRQPVLAIWGAADCQVPAHDSARALRDALDRGGNQTYALRVIPGADHSLHYVGPCDHEIGIHHSSVITADAYFAGVADWVHRLDSDAPAGEYIVPAVDESSPLGWHQTPPAPAPWYGTVPAQLAAILVLLALFGYVTARTVVRRARRHRGDTVVGRLTASTGVLGLVATIVSVVALVELAFLGAIHSAQIVGNGPIAGMPPLFLGAGVLATVVLGFAVALAVSVAGQARSGRTPAAGETRTALLTLGSAGLFVAWVGYWQLPLVLPGLF